MTSFVYLGHEDVFHGHLHFLPELYTRRGSPTLKYAILGVSHLAAFNKWRFRDCFTLARKYYGIAMNALRTTITSDALTSEEIFATILVLALFVVRVKSVRRRVKS
jgi:hypothetical protein